jgi:hypothetical protein
MSCIFTITTCLHIVNKLDQTLKCLHSLFDKENKLYQMQCVLINEYAPDEIDRTQLIHELYPNIEIIQKEKKDVGQTASVNIILNMLRKSKHEFWIHWEESWVLHSPFVTDALCTLNKYPEVSQLQVSKGWDDVPHDKHEMINIVGNKYHERVNTILGNTAHSVKWKKKPWPLFSLQPGVDRVKHVINIDDFFPFQNSVPNGKVNGAEFNFAHRWYLQNVKKGVLTPFRALRDKAHISTSRYIT